VTPAAAAPPWYAGFKLAVFVLLIVNTALFASHGTFSEGLDSAAWFTLLVLFELETAHAGRLSSRRAVIAVHGVRLAAAAAIMAAATGYLHEKAWLDAVNAWLWIAVVALLEVEVRCAQAVARHRGWFGAIAAVLYFSLAGVALVWASHNEWFNAYDAALWLLAFATIEMNVLAGVTGKSAHAPPAAV
jgi:hypothetical protein